MKLILTHLQKQRQRLIQSQHLIHKTHQHMKLKLKLDLFSKLKRVPNLTHKGHPYRSPLFGPSQLCQALSPLSRQVHSLPQLLVHYISCFFSLMHFSSKVQPKIPSISNKVHLSRASQDCSCYSIRTCHWFKSIRRPLHAHDLTLIFNSAW